jgi:hypothetical protein
MAALTVLVGHPAFAGLIITELNPDHGEPDGSTTRTLATGIAAALGRRSASADRRLTLLCRLAWAEGENRPICSRVSHIPHPRLGRHGGGNGQFMAGVPDGFHKAAPDSGPLRPRVRPGVVGDPVERFLRAGVLLAALIMVMLTEGPSGLKASAGMPAWQRHIAITERKELR